MNDMETCQIKEFKNIYRSATSDSSAAQATAAVVLMNLSSLLKSAAEQNPDQASWIYLYHLGHNCISFYSLRFQHKSLLMCNVSAVFAVL